MPAVGALRGKGGALPAVAAVGHRGEEAVAGGPDDESVRVGSSSCRGRRNHRASIRQAEPYRPGSGRARSGVPRPSQSTVRTAPSPSVRPSEVRWRAPVSFNDQMAIGALHELEQRGLRVPEDVAVTGFDGIPLSRLVRPALTTLRQPMLRMGEEAVELLVKRLNGARAAEPASLMLPVTVVRRGSCGCGDQENSGPGIG
ncbi:substrate-binding domain-containing protein [Streptomyces sp. CA-142005]|uniref:substrate-binding domain-containing protein n=1 Tax=Streptomyces sp. CA-142005 TaxID=3240052 RepID=UPI003D8D5874